MSPVADLRLASPRKRRALWLAAAAVATLLALLFTAEQRAFRLALGHPLATPAVLAAQLVRWYLWLGFAPALFALVARWQQARRLRALFRGGLLFVAVLAAALAHAVLTVAVGGMLGVALGPSTLAYADRLTVALTTDLLVAGGVAALSLAVLNYDRARRREARASHLAARLAETRLAMLRMQLRPHFLFNALNSVAALMHSDVRAADAMLTALAELLRATLLGQTQQEVPLSREIELVERYLDIMRIRFGGRIRARLEIEPDSSSALVPSFLLQPLVENAIRHGMQGGAEPRQLVIRARRDRDDLLIQVLNDGAALPAGWHERRHAGLGLRMTRQRLRVLYGPRHRLELINRAEGGVQLALAIPFRSARSALPAA